MATMFEHVGGEPSLRGLAEHFHQAVVADPLLRSLFEYGTPHHTDHLTAFLVEMLGGPSRYSDELGGFLSLMKAHLGLRITPEQQDRFVTLMLASADAVGMPSDERFRTAFEAQVRKAAGFTV
ncbi:group II truncated hemoglobin, partial [Frankia sp. CcWB2]